ncbi:Uu.00g081080.m01.CDS01 [Anthostomella pinea]|uniref:Uu.00g081080.m01.CDS01 n=1 Tax=Anthostomella pinea TaxID=933095 RepID=A0AAI8VLR4_9PEZI|nr:Uu.00g081080.m01.CDS01 [Anthostomella pinea]
MKFQISAVLLGIAASTVAAQETNQTGPFFLHIKGTDNSSIDGYASSCHAGAAIEGLCYGSGSAPAAGSYSNEYYFNYSGYTTVGDADVGTLSWKLPVNINGTVENLPQPMSLQYQANSNVAAPMFGFSSGGFSVGFDDEGKLFGYNYYDDSTFVAGTQPSAGEGKAYYQWYVCYQYLTGYYYQSIGWAQTVPPHNPTCEPVTITQELE